MSEWQPIETAPKGDYVLVADTEGCVFEARGTDDGFFFWVNTPFESKYAIEATHWMPLPEPPK